MAKITLAPEKNQKWIRTQGDNAYTRGGLVFIRTKPKSSKAKVEVQQDVRELMKKIRGYWKTLDSAQKLEWQNYREYVPESTSGWNSFLANNMQGLYPNVPCITPILNITSPATPPDIPTGFLACYYAGLDAICVSWSHDYAQKTYVQAFEWIPPGRSRVANEPWQYVATAESTDKKILVPSARLVAGFKSRIFIRGLNLRGEVSEKTQYLSAPVPPMPIPDWSGNPLSGNSPLSVQFTDESEGLRFGWGWLFGDGSNSALQNPLKTYTSAVEKRYTVSLTLVGPGGAQITRTRPAYVHVTPSSYPYKYTVLVNNSGNANSLTNYQIKLTIPPSSSVYGEAQVDGGNLRFYDSDDTTEISYFIESWVYNGTSVFWIKIPSIPGSASKNIYIGVLTPTETTTSSADNTFDLYDDFEAGTLDTSKWTLIAGTISFIPHYLRLSGTSGTQGHIESKATFTLPIIHEIVAYCTLTGDTSTFFHSMRAPGDWANRITVIDQPLGGNMARVITGLNGVYTNTDVNVTDLAYEVWYKWANESNKARWYQDTELRCTHETNIPTVPLSVNFREGRTTGASFNIGLVRVRQFAEPEPTAALT